MLRSRLQIAWVVGSVPVASCVRFARASPRSARDQNLLAGIPSPKVKHVVGKLNICIRSRYIRKRTSAIPIHQTVLLNWGSHGPWPVQGHGHGSGHGHAMTLARAMAIAMIINYCSGFLVDRFLKKKKQRASWELD